MDDSEKTELTPANDNPWYWLATLYGEQTGEDIDEELVKKNRIAWNRWVAEAFSAGNRIALLENGFNEIELTLFSDIEKKEHYVAVLKRSGRESIALPKPSETVDFSSNRFDHSCSFVGYLFPTEVGFHSAIFCGNAYFESATFSGLANFGPVTFGGNADFGSTTFSNTAYFDSAKFSDGANFGSVTFCENAFFGSSTLSEGANFGPVIFSGYAQFACATFTGYAHFESATVREHADFKSAKFDSDANFVNTKFLSTTGFSDAVFRSAVPRFFGATLHEGTEWHGVEWPPAIANRHDDGDRKDAAQEQVYAYERLKQEMEKLKKHEDEQFFFRKELRAWRELYTWRSTYGGLNFLYEKLSNYGYGVVRPLVAFAALFLVGFALLAIDPFGFAGRKLTKWDAAFTSLANMFGSIPLKTLADYKTDKTFAYSAEIFAIFQTIAGAVLLFFFFLALRNRFRLR